MIPNSLDLFLAVRLSLSHRYSVCIHLEFAEASFWHRSLALLSSRAERVRRSSQVVPSDVDWSWWLVQGATTV